MMKVSACILILALIFGAQSQSNDCQKFVQELIQNIMKLNITSIPLPSIMYSGITTNNPGQFYQCQTANFSYYLVTIKNSTTNINSFTGICVPKICSRQDMQIALEFWNCKVYDFPSQIEHDGLAIAGIVIFSLWISILTVWSVVLSCKQPQINEYTKKQKQQRQNTVNSLVQSAHDSQDNKNLHIFNFYQGYCKIFKHPKRKSLMGSFLFFSVLSILVSTQFSYKQTISSNPAKAYQLFNSGFGVFVTNTEIAFNVIVFILGMKLAYGVYKLNTFHQIGRYYFDQLLKKWIFLVLISLSLYGIASFIDQPLSKYWSLNYGQDCPSCLWQTWFLFRNLLLDTKICMPWLWILQAEIFLTLLSTPFVIIFRVKKRLGYVLMSLITIVSSIVGYAILVNLGIVFQPTKIFNQQRQYVIDYQTNTIVRAAPFFLGLMLGFLIIQGLQKVQGQPRSKQYKIAKKVRRQPCVQYTLQLIGLVCMIFTFSIIGAFLQIPAKGADQTNAYIFISFGSLLFVIGLFLFVLPSFWQGQSWLSGFINSVFGWNGWTQFQKLSICLFVVGPMVMGFTTYCTQNNIYFDYQTIIVYLIGDLTIVYIVCLLACAAIQNQITFIFNWIQTKLFGRQNKYSILLLEE